LFLEVKLELNLTFKMELELELIIFVRSKISLGRKGQISFTGKEKISNSRLYKFQVKKSNGDVIAGIDRSTGNFQTIEHGR
jgi:hypothetical protein